MKIKCLSDYSNKPHGFFFEAGREYEVTPVTATFLMADAPGSFEVVGVVEDVPPVETKEMKAPPRTTAIKRAPRSKGIEGESTDE